jgi:hypothetical protein
MPHFTVQLDTKNAEIASGRLAERAPYAICRALNRAGASAVTLMIRFISQDTGIKQKDLRGTTARNRAIWSSEAKPGNQVVNIYANTERIPLADFSARGAGGASPSNPVPSRGKGTGVSWRMGSQGRKRERAAFFAEMDNGHVGVFKRMLPSEKKSEKRAWSKNLPIDELQGPSIARVWRKYEVAGRERAREQLAKNIRSELRFRDAQRAGALA